VPSAHFVAPTSAPSVIYSKKGVGGIGGSVIQGMFYTYSEKIVKAVYVYF
jgi:hypothetical protein